MNCAVEKCQQPAIITEPVPLCEQDGLAVLAAYITKASDLSKPKTDPLVDLARKDFAALLAAGGLPSVRQLRQTYGIEQDRAFFVREAAAAALVGEAADVRGAEAKRRQIEEATFEAAVLIFTGTAPLRREFGARYDRGETWGRDRYTEAERLMAEDASFAARVQVEAARRA